MPFEPILPSSSPYPTHLHNLSYPSITTLFTRITILFSHHLPILSPLSTTSFTTFLILQPTSLSATQQAHYTQHTLFIKPNSPASPPHTAPSFTLLTSFQPTFYLLPFVRRTPFLITFIFLYIYSFMLSHPTQHPFIFLYICVFILLFTYLSIHIVIYSFIFIYLYVFTSLLLYIYIPLSIHAFISLLFSLFNALLFYTFAFIYQYVFIFIII